jgi:hypothetical protein
MRCIAFVMGVACLTVTGCRARAGVGVEAGIEPAVVVAEEGGDKVWVCHRGRWQEVGAPAGGAHSRHGDRVSYRPRAGGASC